ncbi:MAG: hypothetical protein CMJ83_20035 [Planctomycetes bacterium]|nr:hypothetical protein [Planctomycetota bacterium]
MMTRFVGVMAWVLVFGIADLTAQTPVRAVLLRPWSPTASQTSGFWGALNGGWSSFGSTPLVVDTATFATSFTPAALLANDPDVIVLADPAGGTNQYTAVERLAIEQFLAIPGKRVVGTYVTFSFTGIDNLWLLPWFGFDPNLTLTNTGIGTPSMNILAPHPVLNGLPDPFTTSGYQYVQVPSDLSWDPADYSGSLVARNANNGGIVHYFPGPSHDAVYISFMPEYAGGLDDQQLMYNAMTWSAASQPAISLSGTPTIGSTVTLNLAAPTSALDLYLLALSEATTPGITLGSGRVVPLSPGPFFLFTAGPNPVLLSNIGVINGSGVAAPAPTLIIPNQPGLVGFTIYAAFVTFNAGAPDGISAISPPLAITGM